MQRYYFVKSTGGTILLKIDNKNRIKNQGVFYHPQTQVYHPCEKTYHPQNGSFFCEINF